MKSALVQYAADESTELAELEQIDLEDVEFAEVNEEDMKCLSQCKELVLLSITGAGIKSIKAAFPSLPKITALLLEDNHLENDSLSLFGNLETLEMLSLSGNNISSSEKFANLKGLQSLKHIALHGCPIADTDGYRDELFGILPQLVEVDNYDREGNEIDTDDDEDESDEDESAADANLAAASNEQVESVLQAPATPLIDTTSCVRFSTSIKRYSTSLPQSESDAQLARDMSCLLEMKALAEFYSKEFGEGDEEEEEEFSSPEEGDEDEDDDEDEEDVDEEEETSSSPTKKAKQ